MTNPYEAAFDGVAVLGHSGQPVSDIARQRTDCLPSAKPAEAAYEGEAEEKEAIGAKIGECFRSCAGAWSKVVCCYSLEQPSPESAALSRCALSSIMFGPCSITFSPLLDCVRWKHLFFLQRACW